ncbi:MAG: MBL fold metallo-hydrolase [Nitrospirota bacterium]|nr:MBL fold metallo-hydrolase [Nitrospirota bacterium]
MRKQHDFIRIAFRTSTLSMALFVFLLSTLTSTARADVVWDPASTNLERQQVGQGVYALIPQGAAEANKKGYPVATSGGFIVGEYSVLVVESMINKALAHQVMALVNEVTKKPIRYVVNTSYHGDHSYGNYAFSQDVTIIHHPKTKAYIGNPEILKADKAFMIQNFGANVGIEEVVGRTADILVDDHVSIDLGNKEVHIMHWGFAQTPGDLFVWVPDDKVFWTGNPLVAPPPALPWLLEGGHRESIATMKKVRAFLPSDATVVPGHGRPMQPEEMDFTIQYLETLDNKVQTALANGLSLEQTQQSLSMPTFKGYALWDWVHTGVNIPSVYQALSAQ